MNKPALLAGLVGVLGFLTLTQTGRDMAAKLGELIMDFSDSGLDVIRRFEGFSATPYRDAQGWSIGFGHFILPGEKYTTITKEKANELLKQDAATAAAEVRKSVTVPLNQNQFDALVSLTYNIGTGAFRSSTLLKRLNEGDYTAAADQFARWNKSQGETLAVLTDRRKSERDLFLLA
jgi:GH24 family phage-related lysozyme (muramidase)